MRNHLFFLSTDSHASPFDMNIALDAGFDVALPYVCVKEEQVEGLTHDIIFSRGPKGTKHSAIFVGGSDMELVEKIVKRAGDSMFDPFTVSIFSDPKGAYTTAAALVAKTGKAVGGLSGKKIVIFGGTGPVGQVAAALCSKENADTTIVTSRDKKAGEEAAVRISSVYGVSIKGAAAKTGEERLALIQEADIAIATVKAGIQILSLNELGSVKNPLIVADVNAVPPSGFGGLAPGDDMKQIAPCVKGIGALCIGFIKYKVEVDIFESMLENKITANFKTAYESAKTLA
ncbi:Methylene tetrahydromethanopterin dehydrogenase [hydrothermal vent metagenome]|uniref:Methylene tetrahydromethanopterin dehydrogenase n=1 Tax=hydrothermal vent metagenome TaxID=652676 RepID=A0A3B1C287_9ZZZZ